jgi:hypothetical protein
MALLLTSCGGESGAFDRAPASTSVGTIVPGHELERRIVRLLTIAQSGWDGVEQDWTCKEAAPSASTSTRERSV